MIADTTMKHGGIQKHPVLPLDKVTLGLFQELHKAIQLVNEE
jgi:hypothetical protein